MGLREEVRAELTGPGGPFELEETTVLGAPMQVFKNRRRSLRELLAESAAQGDKEYLVFGERRIRYADHVPAVASLAVALRERYGIGRGDRVAILAANGLGWPLSFWATVSLGGVVAALNGWWTPDEIAYGIADSDPKLLIGDRKRLARARELGLDVPVVEIESELDELLATAPGASLPEDPIAEDDPAVILYTSGTTGQPKGAVGSHRGILGLLQTTMMSGVEDMVVRARSAPPAEGAAAPPPPAQQVVLASSPMFHLSGLYAMVVLQLSLGGKLVIRSGRFDPVDVLRTIEQERITTWAALGGMAPRVAKHPDLEKYDRSSLVSVGFGGAPASPAVQELVRKAFPASRNSLGIGYGSSETVSVVASIRGPEYADVPESAGRVQPTHEVEIRDPSGRALPEGDEGEIHVRSPYLMLEYWQKPEATKETLLSGRWLATGDIGRLDGEFLYINSRARDMILRNAENIHPSEIEHRLDQHPDVRESAVFGIEHEDWGQEVKAVVVPEAGSGVTTEALAAWCAERLAAFKVPTAWQLSDEPLPRNPSGKVLKNVLRGDAENAFIDD
jgi:acyl-CoA synthetase (AMP-forming)/AMP-acid ligase II